MTDFFIIGAVKAGTTSMYAYLSQSPQVAMSRVNWTRFFHVDGREPDLAALGQKYGGALLRESTARFRLMCHRGVPRSFEAYDAMWPARAPGSLRGEVAPTYMYDPYACQRIKTRFPQARIVVILREPVARALSHYVMDLARGWVPERNFEDAIAAEPVGTNEFWWGLRHYVRHGFYATHLRALQQIFDPGQLRIMIHDDLAASPEKFMQELTGWLGIKPWPIDLSKRHNEAPIAKPAVREEFQDRLRALYAPQMEQLRHMIGRDLPGWP